MKKITADNSTIINGIALGFSLAFLAVVPVAAFYTGEWGQILYMLLQIKAQNGDLGEEVWTHKQHNVAA